MKTLKHKHINGLTIELVEPTAKGYKVKQVELYTPWGSKRLRSPKTKTAFYSSTEISDLFTEI